MNLIFVHTIESGEKHESLSDLFKCYSQHNNIFAPVILSMYLSIIIISLLRVTDGYLYTINDYECILIYIFERKSNIE